MSSDEVKALVDSVRRAQLPPPEERRRIREAAGVSQGEAAKALGVSNPALCRWEAGKPITRAHAIAYRELLEALKKLG